MKKLMLFVLAITLTLVSTIPVQADKLSDAQKKQSDINKKLQDIKDQKKAVQGKLNDKKTEQQRLATAEAKKAKELADLKKQRDGLLDSISSLEIDLKSSEDSFKEQQELLKTRIKVMYENSSFSYLKTMLESKSIVDFYERFQLISYISKRDKKLLDELGVAKRDLEYKKQVKENEKQATEDKARATNDKIAALSVSRSDVESDIAKFQGDLKELEKQEDQAERQMEQVKRDIKDLMSKSKFVGGVMTWPCPSSTNITSPFGYRIHPIFKTKKFHSGIDIGAKKGVSIVAALKGTVIVASYKSGYGNTVIIDHGGKIATLYAHASKILVSVGDTVKAGQVIAKVGSTGYSTGPHLHFEVIVDGDPVNPLKYVTRN